MTPTFDEMFEKHFEFRLNFIIMATMLNKTNLNKANTLLITNTSYKYQLYDLEYIATEINKILNKKLIYIFDEKANIIADLIIKTSNLLTDIAQSTSTISNINTSINEIYKILLQFNIQRRILTREEFLSLDLSKVPNDISHNNTLTFPERAQESKLKKYGYSVAKDSLLNNKERQALLKELIDKGKVSKGYVIGCLKHNIQINGKKANNEFAVAKWKDDLDFICKL
ncbi:MAG: hypothetical protein UH080_03350 [Ruminococcus sp.]|nr:hypothetical protein [Ruminococcus sp.]